MYVKRSSDTVVIVASKHAADHPVKGKSNVAVSVLDSITFHHHLNACQWQSKEPGCFDTAKGVNPKVHPSSPKRSVELLASRISPIELLNPARE
jgi:hypothetical protein